MSCPTRTLKLRDIQPGIIYLDHLSGRPCLVLRNYQGRANGQILLGDRLINIQITDHQLRPISKPR